MSAPRHIHEIHIRATPAEVWTAIVDPDWTRRYLFDGAAATGALEVGAGVRFVGPGDDPVGEGVVEILEPGRRLVMTWRVLQDAACAEEAPGRIEWEIEPANAAATVTRVRVRHEDLGLSPATWGWAAARWGRSLDRLKTLLETGADLGPLDAEATSREGAPDGGEIERGWHRALAVEANNSTWEFLDGRDLDDEEAFVALGRAYAAAHHWTLATEPGSINRARAAWLCSRVHATVGDGPAALRSAELCATLTDAAADEAARFDRFYAAEARARALACIGRRDEASSARDEARRLADEVDDPEDRAIVDADLAAPPWYGL